MALTDEQKKKYIARGGVACPYCGGHDIESSIHDAHEWGTTYVVSCSDPRCKRQWEDVYTLTDIRELR